MGYGCHFTLILNMKQQPENKKNPVRKNEWARC